jgi:hypothetical protein
MLDTAQTSHIGHSKSNRIEVAQTVVNAPHIGGTPMSVKYDSRKIFAGGSGTVACRGLSGFRRRDAGAEGLRRRRPVRSRAAMIVSYFDDATGDNAL